MDYPNTKSIHKKKIFNAEEIMFHHLEAPILVIDPSNKLFEYIKKLSPKHLDVIQQKSFLESWNLIQEQDFSLIIFTTFAISKQNVDINQHIKVNKLKTKVLVLEEQEYKFDNIDVLTQSKSALFLKEKIQFLYQDYVQEKEKTIQETRIHFLEEKISSLEKKIEDSKITSSINHHLLKSLYDNTILELSADTKNLLNVFSNYDPGFQYLKNIEKNISKLSFKSSIYESLIKSEDYVNTSKTKINLNNLCKTIIQDLYSHTNQINFESHSNHFVIYNEAILKSVIQCVFLYMSELNPSKSIEISIIQEKEYMSILFESKSTVFKDSISINKIVSKQKYLETIQYLCSLTTLLFEESPMIKLMIPLSL